MSARPVPLEKVSKMLYQGRDGNESSRALYGAARCGEHRKARILELDEGRSWIDAIEIRPLRGLRREGLPLEFERVATTTRTVVWFYNEAPREKDSEGSRSDSRALLAKASG